jgi:hypothetical protein
MPQCTHTNFIESVEREQGRDQGPARCACKARLLVCYLAQKKL